MCFGWLVSWKAVSQEMLGFEIAKIDVSNMFKKYKMGYRLCCVVVSVMDHDS